MSREQKSGVPVAWIDRERDQRRTKTMRRNWVFRAQALLGNVAEFLPSRRNDETA
jgi:hypothetical protein